MDININVASPEPVYEQIVRQIHDGVKNGTLLPGAQLPTVRQLAIDLVLNRNTVARAFKILEDQGVIQTAGRKGTFVRRHAAEEVERMKSGRAERTIRRTIDALLSNGLSRGEIDAAFKRALALQSSKEKTS